MRRLVSLLGILLVLAMLLRAQANISQPAPVKPTDGTNSITVKAASTAPAATDTALVVTQSPNGGDPCRNPSQAKSSAKISATATSQLVALAAGQTIYVCGFYFSNPSAATAQFEYGTGTTCATGTTTLTGVMTNVSDPKYAPGLAAFQTASGNALCLVLGGTSPSAQGVLTYVQK